MGLVVFLGVASAFVYGGSDFLGGVAARRMASTKVTAISFLFAFVTVAAVLPFTASAWSARAVFFGTLAGLVGVVGVWLLYVSLATGPMSILSPVVAVIGAVVPVAYGLTHHEHVSPLGDAALVVIVVAAGLVAASPRDKGVHAGTRSLAVAVASGLAIGVYLVLIDETPRSSGLVPIFVDVGVGAAVLFGVLALRRFTPLLLAELPGARGSAAAVGERSGGTAWFRRAGATAAAAGVSLGVGNAFLVIGIHLGALAVIAALNALYPIGTIVLARVMTGERVSGLQGAGLVLAVVAAAMLTVA